ncbi:MAG: ribosome-inactivating family protein, partial [Rhodanobacter sp.]
MIDDGIFFSYENDRAYAKSVQSIRDRLCVHNGNYYTLVDRQRRTMRRFAVSIFDERNDSTIDVCLLGNTLYILAMRLAEMKWFKTHKQPVEFAGCDGSIAMELPFEGGYGELGISGSSGHPRFTRDQASMHTAAMKDYMLATASGGASSTQEL